MKYNIRTKAFLLLIIFYMCSFGATLKAQDQTPFLKGIVNDEFGKPLADVVINSENGKNRTFTNGKGEYSIIVNDGSKYLSFSFIGYAENKVRIEQSNQANVTLKSDAHKLNEVIQLGYSSQKRGELSGSVSTVSGEELTKSPVANLSMTFDGRLPGLFTQETYSELSRANTDLYVRGISAGRANGPLVIIDGIICSYSTNETLEYITPSEIESVSLLKDASTEALYGIQGANGVIVITTKRGKEGKLRINARFDESIQQVTTQPPFFSSSEYATLRNEAAVNDRTSPKFTDEQIANYKSGKDRNLYPNTNWYDMYMRKFAQMQRVGVDLQGGNNRIQYYTDINIMHQGSQFKDDHPEYKSNINTIWTNFRSNVDMNLTKYLGAYLHLSGNIKRERTPGGGFSDGIYSSIFDMPATVYGPVTPVVIDPSTGKTSGGQVITTSYVDSPTYGKINRSGFNRHTVTNIYSQAGLNLDMSFLTKGLSASGVFMYQTNSVSTLNTSQDYERWVKTDNNPDLLDFIKKGINNNTPLAYSKGSQYYYHITTKAMMDYDRDFGLHHVSGMAYMLFEDLSKADESSPGCLPYDRINSGVEVSYGYNQKYLLKFDLGYSGSEQYARGNRYTTTPAISGAWVISRESFMHDLNGISNLKLRASYGKTANDQSGLGRFAYTDNVTLSAGGPIESYRYYVNELQIGNPHLQAEISKKQNYGIDLGLFNSLSLSVDMFKERMDNMVVAAVATVPSFQGIPLNNYPCVNNGIFENKGYEITANYIKAINKDLTVSVGGSLSHAKNTIISWNEALRTDDFAYRKWEEGYSYGQTFGYLVDYSNKNGFFNSQKEIDDSHLTYKFGIPRIGDLKYKDLNHDNIIDEKDEAPIGTGALPRYYYSFNGGLNYKSFDFSFMFQGVGQWSSIYGGTGVYETSNEGIFGSLHRNAWTAERYAKGEKITAPALSLSKSVSQEPNDYYCYNRAYLRLKNVEIGYTLPDNIAKAISVSKVRFILSGQNLLTWDKMKSDDFGPEGSYTSIPVYRVYNVGLSIQF